MHLLSHNVRRFTQAESFRSFMEGVHELHHYDKEIEQAEPNEDLLNLHLKRAQDFFRKCVEDYSNDLLPRYYLAIVLTLQGQAEQARRLRSELLGQQPETTALSPDDLFLLAAKHFEIIAQRADWGKGGHDLSQYSEYNRAQALAKTQPIVKSVPAPTGAFNAERVPQLGPQFAPVPPLDDSARPPDGKKIDSGKTPDPGKKMDSGKSSDSNKFSIAKWFRPSSAPVGTDRHWDTALQILQSLDAGLKPVAGNTPRVSTGATVRLGKKEPQDRAFVIQVRVLEYAIQLRKAVFGGREPDLDQLPKDQESEKKLALKSETRGTAALDGAAATVREFIARIQEDTIRSDAQSEIVADYWNKLAFIAWEKATLNEMPDDTEWLQRARKYINIATTCRPNWTPGQLNLARIQWAEGKTEDAKATLEKVLGKKKTPPPAVPPLAPSPDSDAIAAVILKMAVERNPKALAAHVQRCYGALSQETIRKATEALAGKVDSGLLDDILSGVQIKAEPVPK